MTALPAATDFTGASITEAQFKTALTNMRAFLSELLGASGTDRVAALTALGAILCDSLDKTGAYTVVAADKGKVINCSGTWSLSLTAAATLGDGFAFAVWNNGSGTITLDPNVSELIDGATTKALAAGKLAIVYCDGVKFVTVGGFALADLLAVDGAGSGIDADLLDGQHGSYYVNRDIGVGAIGTIAVMYTEVSVASGATVAGSSLRITSANNVGGAWLATGATQSGTWRNIGAAVDGVNYFVSTFQRIS